MRTANPSALARLLPSAAVAAATFACACAGPSPRLHAQTIPKGDIVVDLENFAVLPNSGSQHKPARVNLLRAAPDGRIFINDQRGPLYLVSADGAQVTLYLDLNTYLPLLADEGERGFQTFAFHPDFFTPNSPGYGKFYTVQSQSDTTATATFVPGVTGAGRDHDEVLLEWTTLNPSAPTFVPANPAQPFRELLRIAKPAGNHNGGYLAFNPTAGAGPDRGNLYYGIGDSGGGGDPLGLAQMLGNGYGAILRINPLPPGAGAGTPSGNGRYTIPLDNPFKTNSAFAPEKFAAGFRNPQRFVWDSANGRMFITDIGQNKVEEVDIGLPGLNYGWNLREGSYVFNSDGTIGANVRSDAAATGLTYPIAEYLHFGGIGNAVTAGTVYRDTAIPQLAGRFVFSDFPTGTAYTISADTLPDGGSGAITELRLRVNGAETSFLDLIKQVNSTAARADLRFGVDAQRNLYFLDKQDGVVRRVVKTAPSLPDAYTVGVRARESAISRVAHQRAKIFFTRSGGDLNAETTVNYALVGSAVNGRDYALRALAATIPAGRSRVKLKVVPLAGGSTGKVKLVLLPGAGYGVDGAARRVKVRIVD